MGFLEGQRESGEALTDRPEAWQIYEYYVKQGDVVAVQGLGKGIFNDPTAAWAAHRIMPDGEVLACDPQEEDGDEDTLRFTSQAGPVHGAGSVRSYLADIAYLRDTIGISFAPVKTWPKGESGLLRILAPDNSVHAIIDHNTSIFVGIQSKKIGHELFSFLGEVFATYRRALTPGGAVLFQTDCAFWFHGDEAKVFRSQIANTFKASGFSVQHHRVIDQFRIPLTPEQYSRLCDYQSPGMVPYYNLLDHTAGDYALILPGHSYPGPDLFVAVKLP